MHWHFCCQLRRHPQMGPAIRLCPIGAAHFLGDPLPNKIHFPISGGYTASAD
jgi:hypothetical protein